MSMLWSHILTSNLQSVTRKLDFQQVTNTKYCYFFKPMDMTTGKVFSHVIDLYIGLELFNINGK